MRRVIIESPYAADKSLPPEERARVVAENLAYLRRCMRDCVVARGETPYASHGLLTQEGVLDDDNPEERELGIRAGLVWGEVADATVVYLDRGLSQGMREGVKAAQRAGRLVEFRWLELQGRTTLLYALVTKPGTARPFEFFFSSRTAAASCGSEPVVRVRGTVDDAGSYWGWWETESSSLAYVYPSRSQVEVCFPYGTEEAEQDGRGKLCRVRVEEVPE